MGAPGGRFFGPNPLVYADVGLKFIVGDTPCDENVTLYAQEYEVANVRHVVRLDDQPYREIALTSRGLIIESLIVKEGGGPSPKDLKRWRSLVREVQERNREATPGRARPRRCGRRRPVAGPEAPERIADPRELEVIAIQTAQPSSAALMIALALQALKWKLNTILKSLDEGNYPPLLPAHAMYLNAMFSKKRELRS